MSGGLQQAVGAPAIDHDTRPLGETGWHRGVRIGAGSAVLALWLVWAVAAWVQGPREVSFEQVRADIASGEVVAAVVGRVDDDGPGWRISGVASRIQQDSDGPVLVYRLDSGGVRMIDTGTYDRGVENTASALFAQLTGSGQLDEPFGYWDDRYLWTGAAAGFVAFVSIVGWIGGTRGTRWFWFWMLFCPLGVGVVAYAVLEHLRPRVGPIGEQPRHPWSGLRGAAFAFLVVPLAVGLVGAGVEALLGPGLLPTL